VTFLAFPAASQPKPENIPGVSYNVSASLADNLKAFVGKKVYVTLNSGKVLTGRVKAAGAQLVHVEELEGKEYFDALIQIQHIAAIDTRFRQLKR
jgi:ribosome maturation factor RimP